MVKDHRFDAALLGELPGSVDGISLLVFVCQRNPALRFYLPVVRERNDVNFISFLLHKGQASQAYRGSAVRWLWDQPAFSAELDLLKTAHAASAAAPLEALTQTDIDVVFSGPYSLS